ncbi:cytochrome b N-terminal domain-containing protein [Breoghania sp.]|uniref:cytochrome b N-terminal domain-containing protein n=1 Tax=Breoghania sp. TaxID=2065378 RepID=UPI0029C81A0B|nr:cytochrome b N-terminal domain-containing protein [Breoghania sp.]
MPQQASNSIVPTSGHSKTGRRHSRFLLRNLVLHFRPTTVPRETLRFSLTWGLGGMAATLIVLLMGSGLLLKFAYEPTPVAAHASVQALITGTPYGKLIRNLHHWCAHLVVAVMLLHMLRVFCTGAFHRPRQFNWVVGLGLMTVVLGSNFTGYLLPWDQLAYWAVTVSTGMLEYVPLVGAYLRETILSDGELGPRTLQLFYALHTAVLPVVLMALMAYHFWRIRKARGIVVPRPIDAAVEQNPVRVPVVPDLLLRETTTALVLIAAVLLLATLVDAPLGEPGNPGLSPNPTRAPWYFAGLQELLLHFHPVLAVFVIPLVVGFGLLAIPYLKYETDTGGIWFASRKGRKTAGVAGITAFIAMPLLILADTWLAGAGSSSSVLANGWLPALAVLLVIGGYYAVIKIRFHATKNETVQSVFILLATSYAILTITGVWFRGEGMALTIPW